MIPRDRVNRAPGESSALPRSRSFPTERQREVDRRGLIVKWMKRLGKVYVKCRIIYFFMIGDVRNSLQGVSYWLP